MDCHPVAGSQTGNQRRVRVPDQMDTVAVALEARGMVHDPRAATDIAQNNNSYRFGSMVATWTEKDRRHEERDDDACERDEHDESDKDGFKPPSKLIGR
jgi:hypothetical protein